MYIGEVPQQNASCSPWSTINELIKNIREEIRMCFVERSNPNKIPL